MTRYRNVSGKSGVAAYELSDGAIAVQFKSGDTYVYTNASAGSANVAKMMALAESGSGLSAFIAENVRDRFARKL